MIQGKKEKKQNKQTKTHSEQAYSKERDWINNFKTSHKDKAKHRWLYWWILPNIPRVNINSSQTFKK